MSVSDNALAEILRRKNILSQFGGDLPDKMPEPALTVAVKHSIDTPSIASQGSGPYDTSPSGDTVVPPSTSEHPLLDAYQKVLQNQPGYKEPSMLRKVLGGLAAGTTGAFLGPKVGGETGHDIIQGANSSAQRPWQAQAAKAKALADIEGAQEEQSNKELAGKGKADLTQAQIGEQNSLANLHNTDARVYKPLTKQDEIDIKRASEASSLPQTVEVETKDGGKKWALQDPLTKVIYEQDPTKADNRGAVISPDIITRRSDPGKSLKDSVTAGAKTPFELWLQQNPDGNATDWLKEQRKDVQNEYSDFREGYLQKHPNAHSDEIASAYSQMKGTTSGLPVMVAPGGRVFRAAPGTNLPEGSQTPTEVGQGNTETSATRTMRETAPKVISLADKVSQEVDNQVSSLGPANSRWNEFMAGKVGAPNPEFTKLRTDAMLLQTLLMRMHVGARGGQQLMQHFHDLIDTAKQSPENLKAALGEIKDYAAEVGKQGSSQEKTATKRFNPATGKIEDK